jgi:hypothetical protein
MATLFFFAYSRTSLGVIRIFLVFLVGCERKSAAGRTPTAEGNLELGDEG